MDDKKRDGIKVSLGNTVHEEADRVGSSQGYSPGCGWSIFFALRAGGR